MAAWGLVAICGGRTGVCAGERDCAADCDDFCLAAIVFDAGRVYDYIECGNGGADDMDYSECDD